MSETLIERLINRLYDCVDPDTPEYKQTLFKLEMAEVIDKEKEEET